MPFAVYLTPIHYAIQIALLLAVAIQIAGRDFKLNAIQITIPNAIQIAIQNATHVAIQKCTSNRDFRLNAIRIARRLNQPNTASINSTD